MRCGAYLLLTEERARISREMVEVLFWSLLAICFKEILSLSHRSICRRSESVKCLFLATVNPPQNISPHARHDAILEGNE
jgi:hypothetical protein